MSWRILFDSFQTIYEQLRASAAVQPLVKTTTFRQWAERLQTYAQSPALQQQRGYWHALAAQPVAQLPRDLAEGDDLVSSSAVVTAMLSPEETQALLQHVPVAYQTQVRTVLLTALVCTIAEWAKRSVVRLDLEGHGRETLFADIDLSNTIGWFTTIYPVCFDLSATTDLKAALGIVHATLQAIPDNGIGYGLLRYLTNPTGAIEPLESVPGAELMFNYLGQFNQTTTVAAFQVARESSGPLQGPDGRRPYALEIGALVYNNVFQVSWVYSAHCYRHTTIEHLAAQYIRALRTLIAQSQAALE